MGSDSCRCPLGAVRHSIEMAGRQVTIGEYDAARILLTKAEGLLDKLPPEVAEKLMAEIESVRIRIADTGEWDISALRRE